MYSKAYERFPTPALLFDIGQCHKLLHDYERALFFFRGYLRAKPTAPNRPTVEQLISESQHNLDEQQKEAAEAATHRPSAPEPGQTAPTPPLAADAAQPPAVQPLPPAPRANPALGVGGVVVAGVGAALLGTGVYFGLHAASLSNEISQVSASHGTWTSQYESGLPVGQERRSDSDRALQFPGAVALAAGGLLTFLGWEDGQEPHAVTTGAMPAPGGGVVGRWPGASESAVRPAPECSSTSTEWSYHDTRVLLDEDRVVVPRALGSRAPAHCSPRNHAETHKSTSPRALLASTTARNASRRLPTDSFGPSLQYRRNLVTRL